MNQAAETAARTLDAAMKPQKPSEKRGRHRTRD
jgi:hypothetical protein